MAYLPHEVSLCHKLTMGLVYGHLKYFSIGVSTYYDGKDVNGFGLNIGSSFGTTEIEALYVD